MKRSFWTELFDLFAPRLCVGCNDRLLPTEAVLCRECLEHMPLTHYADSPLDNRMARLFWGRIAIERAAALFFYEPHSEMAHLVHAFKYHDRPDVAEQMGRLVADRFEGLGFFEGIDALVPVPLSAERERHRGYNQCELIARGIASRVGLPIYNKVLRRMSFVESQTHLNAFERRENVEKAFVLADDQLPAHRHLMLVDDVMTTGSTLLACAEKLLQAEGVKVSMLTLGFSKS